MRLLPATCMMFMISCAVQAAGHPCAMGEAIIGEFQEFRRGSTFRLTGSEQDYVLANILIDELGGRPPSMSGLLSLHAATHKPDRYGRIAVHAFQNRTWIQGDLLQNGHGLAFGRVKTQDCLQALLQAEDLHRARHFEYWQKKGLELNAVDDKALSGKTGQFVLIRGKVRSVGDRKRRLYLNFGENWAHDFTVSVSKSGADGFGESLERLKGRRGKTVLVRGTLEERQGPLVRIVDDIQIQIIE